MSFQKPLAVLIIAVVALAATTGVDAATVTYNFNSLTGSAAGTALNGQDNWIGLGGSMLLRNDQATYFSGGTGNIAYNGSDAQSTRVNNGGFSYSLANAVFELSFKVRRNTGVSSYFGLGADSGDAGTTLGNTNNEVAMQFGWQLGNFFIRDAAQGTLVTAASGLATNTLGLEIKLVVDPNANGGNGSGSLLYRSIGAGAFTAVASLTNIDLNLTAMAVGFQTPSTWNGMYIRNQTGGAMDDLTISQTILVVPTPAALPAGLGLIGLLAVRRRRNA